ncbi:MAG TPA: His/Gly/Thr/Pro-type tRNA ligase C-terminal domain-containing protein, partial [Nitrososphaerales archaeon]
GAAGGVERMAMSLSAQPRPARNLAYVAVAGREVSAEAQRAVRQIRDSGIPCESPLQQRSLSKQLEDASRMGATWAVILGEKERKAKGVTLRDMRSGDEELLPLDEAIRRMTHT